MRELKFRAWDKKRKCYAKHIMTTNTSCPYHDRMNMFRGVMTFAKWVLHRYAIEQYTGLKDKNGKEIYEGDILGGIWESGFIAWCEKCKQFQYHGAGIGCMACSGDVHWNEMAEDDGKLEVIGNIHENADLLEAEE